MKGMMNLLEKAGLVSRVDDDTAPASATSSHVADAPAPAPTAPPQDSADAPAVEDAMAMSLEQIYEAAGVPPCPYPAERLLRLLDGLKAMDDAMRLQTIRAIDAADDSWTIDDPQRDAAAKVAALERHAATIRAGLARAEQLSQAQLGELTQRQESSVSEIRRQISDLEGLLAREIARGAQEHAALESALQSQRESANRELAQLSRTAGALTSLIAQFNVNPTV